MNDNNGHRERLRKKYLKSGSHSLHDYEMIELLLTFIIPRKDTKQQAKDLLKKFENIHNIITADYNELIKINGLSERGAVLFPLIKDICTKVLSNSVENINLLNNSTKIADFAKLKMGGLKEEHFMVFFLNTKNHLIHHEIETKGTVNQAVIYPRNVMKKALQYNAVSIIIVHNHPTGMCEPSAQDTALTQSIKKAGETIGIQLLDHIIVGKFGHFGFKENNLI